MPGSGEYEHSQMGSHKGTRRSVAEQEGKLDQVERSHANVGEVVISWVGVVEEG